MGQTQHHNVVSGALTLSGERSVSVVIPARNVSSFVRQAVDSVLTQTLVDVEVIVVDDASTDATRAVVAGIDDPRVRLLDGSGAGVSAARNRGWRAAHSRYIAFQDGDDVSAVDRLARQCDYLDSHPEVMAVGSSYWAIDDAGRPINEVTHLSAPADVEAAMYSFNPFCGSSLMVRRSALVLVGGFDEQRHLAEDYELCVRLLTGGTGRLANLPDPLYMYRWHGRSTSVRRRVELEAAQREVRDLLWSRRPYAGLHLRDLLQGDELHSSEELRLRVSAWLQLALGLGRRGSVRGPLLLGLVVLRHPRVAYRLLRGRLSRRARRRTPPVSS